MTPEDIKATRRQLGLTQEGLGKKLGCSGDAVLSWEKGRTRPRGRALERLKRLTAQHEKGGA